MAILESVRLLVIAVRQPFGIGNNIGGAFLHPADLAVSVSRWQATEMSQTVQQAAAANSQGMNALRQGDFKAAAEAFERAIAADPHSGALLRNLASAHRGAGDD